MRPGFLRRVLRFSIPAGIAAGACAYTVYEMVRRLDGVGLAEARTAATITLLGAGLVVLVVVSRPMQTWKIGLGLAMAAMYVIVMVVPFVRDYFELVTPSTDAWIITIIGTLAAGLGVWLVPAIVGRIVSEE